MHITPFSSGRVTNQSTQLSSGSTLPHESEQNFSLTAGGQKRSSVFSRFKAPVHSLARIGAACLIAASAILPAGQIATAAPASQRSSATPYLVGAGAADITGEPGEVGFMGTVRPLRKG